MNASAIVIMNSFLRENIQTMPAAHQEQHTPSLQKLKPGLDHNFQ